MAKKTDVPAKSNEQCVVRPCPNCKPHEFQDKRYGPKQRVMNQCSIKNGGYRCTVCSGKAN